MIALRESFARPATLVALIALAACSPGAAADKNHVARSTLVIGIDVSGSFGSRGRYESSIDFAANYLYGHLHGLGELKQPTAVFVGSIGGFRSEEHTSELQSPDHLVCRLLLEKKKERKREN